MRYKFEYRKPRQNIFNVFEKGKDFFIIRTVVTIMAMVALIIGCMHLAKRAWDVYPVVIRDSFGNVTMGTGSTYRETPIEVRRIASTVAESMFTKTEEGIAETVLAPYVSPEILSNLRSRTVRDGYISTAYTSDYFTGDIDRERGLMVVFMQLEIVATSFNNIMVDNAYINFVMRQGPRTPQNPSGWRIIAMQPISRANYFENRRQHVKDELGSIPSAVDLININSLLD